MEIGEVVKKKRLEFKMTQEELAQTLFVSRPLISKWENGKSYPDLDQLIQLSDLFDI
ncbi:helix-turn-helix domain-containing protein, partial [Vagococcus sp.]|uniref:helix-turn-helix domain-containing protein n=1 Tax=Vagococcus sp. TaxID=1933889 RepID=UPI003FCEE035